MPVVPAISYPGVYIQEVPTGSHTIVGVATSITAFIGRTLRGPVNTPIITTSYADFEQTFGGSWSQSNLPDAVRDFYLNGGAQAVVVRLYHQSGTDTPPSMPPMPAVTVTEVPTSGSQDANQLPAGGQSQSGNQASRSKQSRSDSGDQTKQSASSSSNVPASTTPSSSAPVTSTTNAVLTVGGLTLEARDPGAWGNNLVASISTPDVRNDTDAQSRYGLNKADLFNLSVTDAKTQTTEIFRNVTVQANSPQRVDQVLIVNSNLVFAPGPLPQSVTIPATGNVENQVKDDGLQLSSADFLGGEGDTFDLDKKGLYALENVDLFNLLCIPPYNNGDVDTEVAGAAASYCEQRRAMLILDPPSRWTNKQIVTQEMQDPVKNLGTSSANAMVYFPRVKRAGDWQLYAPSGAIAGIIARTDTQRGVWKAPAGVNATIMGISELSTPLTDLENGVLNPLGVNCLRTMPSVGPVVWGARTLQGADILSSDWKYVPVRRLALYVEESLYRSTRWAVFEPNDDALWSQLRLSIGGFLNDLYRQGAFQGQSAKDAYFVQCDSTTTTQADIDKGIVNVYVGFAPVKPAEFVILYLQPAAGQTAM